MSLAMIDVAEKVKAQPAGVGGQEVEDHLGARCIVGRGIPLFDRDVEQRGVARTRDDAAPNPIRVREQNLRVEDGPAKQQRRLDRRVEHRMSAQAEHGLAAKAQHGFAAKAQHRKIVGRRECQRHSGLVNFKLLPAPRSAEQIDVAKEQIAFSDWALADATGDLE